MARGSAGLGKVVFGSAMQGLWLGYRKEGSDVIGEDRSQFSGRGTVGEIWRGGRGAIDRAKERVHRFRVSFGRERRASCLPRLSLSLGFGDDRQKASLSGGVSLTTFIASVSGSESLASFTNCILHFSGPPGFRMAFDAAERNERFGCI